jgi:hypothetical protein
LENSPNGWTGTDATRDTAAGIVSSTDTGADLDTCVDAHAATVYPTKSVLWTLLFKVNWNRRQNPSLKLY